ncbi:MAG: hypothetical protein H6728_15130 [Myxococcales bacterium]|nr:hypothetical protein [Myxococcales bacterium]
MAFGKGSFFLCFLGLLFFFPQRAQAITASWELSFGPRFNWDYLSLDSSTDPPSFSSHLIAGSLLAGFEADVEWNTFVQSAIKLDLGALQGGQYTNSQSSIFRWEWNNTVLNPLPDEIPADALDVLLKESFLIRELYTHFYFTTDQWIGIRAGMMNLSIGRAAVYDNFALGIRFLMDLSERESAALPLRWKLDVFLPDASFTSAGKKSPVVHTMFEYLFDDDHSIGLSAAYLYDGDSLASQLLYPIMRDTILTQLETLYNKRNREDINFSCLLEPQAPSNTDAPYKTAKTNHQKAYEELQKCESGELQCDENKLASLQSILAVPAEIDGMTAAAKLQQQRGRIPATALLPRAHYLNACSGNMESQGHHFWVGVEGNFKWKNLHIEGSAHLYYSRMQLVLSREPTARPKNYLSRSLPSNLRNKFNLYGQRNQSLVSEQVNNDPPETITDNTPLTGLGFGGQLKITYDWHPMFSTAAFFVFLTGDNVRVSDNTTIHAFMGLAPQLRYTNIFFNGGINAESSQRNISIAGITGRGVIAPGMILRFHIDKKVKASRKKKKANAQKAKKLAKKIKSKIKKKPEKDQEEKEDKDQKKSKEKPTTSKPSLTKPPTTRGVKKEANPPKARKDGKKKDAKKKKEEEDEEDDEDDEEEADEEETETVSVVEVLLKAAPIWSHELPLSSSRQSPKPGNFYGFEVDLEATYRITPWMSAAFELDFFFPGNFFLESRPPTFIVNMLVGLNFKFQ